MPDIRNLRFVVLAADFRSFSRAASRIGIKQSTLSKHVLDLECRLGIKLFKRSTRGAVPTENGERVIALARKILGDVQQLKTDAQALHAGITGRLTTGFHISLSAGDLRTLLLDYGAQHPELNFEVVERDREELARRLAIGLVDLCFLAGETPLEGTAMMPLWSERMMVLIPERSPLIDQPRIHWSDLRNETFLVPERDPGAELIDIIIRHLAEPGFRPHIVVRDLSPENVLHIAGAAGMVTIAGQSASGTIYPDAVFRELFEVSAPSQIGFSAYWRKENPNPALGAFLRYLRSRYS
ncbi:MAG: LysR substrate-binding domain-containing protein [Novosphingobium sp.]